MKAANQISSEQGKFIDFLLSSGVLLFGDFTTKSGRKTPYFINTGFFDDGQKIATLGSHYADKIVKLELAKDTSLIFGPAYKGIPLCVATAAALYSDHGIKVGFVFDRKEAKDHGDIGNLVGKKIKAGERAVIVEDVITAGTTIKQVVPMLRESLGIAVEDVIVSVDRSERGAGEVSAIEELQQQLKVKVHPIVTIHDIRTYLSGNPAACPEFTPAIQDNLDRYLKQYGATS